MDNSELNISRRYRFAERLLPNPGKNVPYLDAIRGMAVVFILFRHAWGLSGQPTYVIGGHSFSPLIMMMSSGVDLFFVLSGMLLAAKFVRADALGRPSPSFIVHMKSRILRIGPPYWVILGLVLLIFTPTMIPNDRVWSTHGAFMVFAHASFTQSLFLVSFGAYMVDSPFWTLTVEMVFYLVLPLMVRAFYKGRWWQGVIAAYMLTAGWLYLCHYHMDWLIAFLRSHTFGLAYSEPGTRFFLSHQLLGYLPHFAIGCSIAAIIQNKSISIFTSRRAGVCYLVIGILIMLATMQILGSLSVANDFYNPEHLLSLDTDASLIYYFGESMPFAMAYGLILLGLALSPEVVRRGLAKIPLLALFGVLGYSIYLIHMPIYYLLNQHAILASDLNPLTHFPKLFALGTFVAVIVSLGLFTSIERPSMVWASNAGKRSLPVVVDRVT